MMLRKKWLMLEMVLNGSASSGGQVIIELQRKKIEELGKRLEWLEKKLAD